MKSSAFIILWILLSTKTAATESEAMQIITDENYRFVLSLPDEDWTLLEEAEISQLAPDMIAGVNSKAHPALWGAISVESMPGVDLKEMMHLRLEDPIMEDQRTELMESMVWQGWPAVRVVFSGRIGGVAARYVQQVLAREGFVYYVTAWGPQAVLDMKGRQAQPFFDAFELLDGPVITRQMPIAVRDQTGVGWRLVDGGFDSVVAGLAIRAQSPWRVIVGTELAERWPDAEVGLVRRDPHVQLALLVEKVPEDNREVFETDVWYNVVADATPFDMPPLANMVGGEMVRFYGFEKATANEDLLHGILWRGDYAVRIHIWYPTAHREQIEALLTEALSAIRFLPPAELDQLKAELEHTRDPENVVGSDFALRNGLYQSFSSGFQWRKPSGFWRARVGAAARAQFGAELYFHEPTLGLHGLIISEPISEQSPNDYHAAATTDWLGKSVPAEHVTSGGGKWRISKGRVNAAGVDHTYHVATAVKEDQSVQVVVSGLSADMFAHVHQATEVLAGFEFKPGLAPVEEDQSRYVDYRMGFSLQPPAGWTRVDITQTYLEELQTLQSWFDESQRPVLIVLAANAFNDNQDQTWFINQYQKDMDQTIGADQYVAMQGELAGLPAYHFSSNETQTWILSRDRTHYALAIDAEAVTEFKRVSDSFRLIDEADPAHPAAVRALDTDSMRDAYIQAIQTVITNNWLRPITTPPGMRCAVTIVQLPGGKIDEVEIAQPCNADKLIRHSIIQAVQRTGSLPYAGFEAVFESEIVLDFVSE